MKITSGRGLFAEYHQSLSSAKLAGPIAEALAVCIAAFGLVACSDPIGTSGASQGEYTAAAESVSAESEFDPLQNAAEAGNTEAQYQLAVAYAGGGKLSGRVEPDVDKATWWYMKAADGGHSMAQFHLATHYEYGLGVDKNPAKAQEWYSKAASGLTTLAEEGDPHAQDTLAGLYSIGNGVPKDEAIAAQWYAKAVEGLTKAAVLGDMEAQYTLSYNYYLGDGVAKDLTKSAEWLTKAAEQGEVRAYSDLAFRYRRGEGVPKDLAKAAQWTRKAAEQGDNSAAHTLGLMYSIGEGGPKDQAEAAKWYSKAAVQGDAYGQESLGWCYAEGKGVARDMVLAYAWFNLSSTHGNALAGDYRDQIERQMAPAQIAEAQRISANWRRGILLSRESSVSGKTTLSEQGKTGTGTGFIVSDDGFALTNHHVIQACNDVKVGGHEGAVRVVSSDTVNDLALLHVSQTLPAAVSLSHDPKALRQGDEIVVYGYPLNAVLSAGGNLVSGLVSALTGLGNNTSQIQITAPIQPGSSGSPVFNRKGHVVGMVSMKLSDQKIASITGQIPQNVNFAVKEQTLRSFLDANKVSYKTGSGLFSWGKDPAEIAQAAQAATVMIECWN